MKEEEDESSEKKEKIKRTKSQSRSTHRDRQSDMVVSEKKMKNEENEERI